MNERINKYLEGLLSVRSVNCIYETCITNYILFLNNLYLISIIQYSTLLSINGTKGLSSSFLIIFQFLQFIQSMANLLRLFIERAFRGTARGVVGQIRGTTTSLARGLFSSGWRIIFLVMVVERGPMQINGAIFRDAGASILKSDLLINGVRTHGPRWTRGGLVALQV